MHNKLEFSHKSSVISNALKFATLSHQNQKRKSGEDFICHPISVANILFGWVGLDENLLAAALLHDVVEDTSVNIGKIESSFGSHIAKIVNGVSKLKSSSSIKNQLSNAKKLAKYGYLDPKIFVLKLADRLHNMKTLNFMSRKDQIIKATETKEIFSQLAESLGMWEVKKELDDLSLSYLQPKNYKLTSQEIRKDPRVTFYYKKIIQNIEAIIPKSLKSEINFIINSVSAVELKKNKNLEQGITSKPDIFYVNDVVSIRVLTKNINDCYRILGMIESHFAPLIDESRFDNFLLRPALNGYSALQTTINTEYGALEIAITTEDRENFNKHGILVYLRNNDIKMLDKFRLKVVFSANGKAYYLPKDALVLDLIFLYPSLFSGSKLIKVNGKKIDPLEKIPGGSIFKVYGNQKDVKVDFKKAIKICLPSTVASIRKASHVLLRDQKRTSGRKILNRLLKSRGVLELDDLPELRDQFVTYFQTHSSSNLYLSVGLGAINNSDIINFLDRNNFNKTALLYTSMIVTGKNKPGVLAQISESISRLGGDIRSLNQNVQKGRFNMRFLIYGLDRDAEQKLSTKMKNSKLFTRLVIV